MKKTVRTLTAVLLLVCALFTMSSCGKTNYGDLMDSRDALVRLMQENGLEFLYPSQMGCDSESAEYQYIAVRTPETGDYSGYKLYCFGSPFYTSVTAYNETSDTLMSDEESRTPFLKEIGSSRGTVRVYAGKGHKDALYLIGCINLGEMHYEVRITSDEEMENNLYVHAIYEDNEYFTQAIQIMTAIIEGLQ